MSQLQLKEDADKPYYDLIAAWTQLRTAFALPDSYPERNKRWLLTRSGYKHLGTAPCAKAISASCIVYHCFRALSYSILIGARYLNASGHCVRCKSTRNLPQIGEIGALQSPFPYWIDVFAPGAAECRRLSDAFRGTVKILFGITAALPKDADSRMDSA